MIAPTYVVLQPWGDDEIPVAMFPWPREAEEYCCDHSGRVAYVEMREIPEPPIVMEDDE